MNKHDLVLAIQKRLNNEGEGISRDDIVRTVEAFADVVRQATMIDGDQVRLIGFGTFAARERPSRVINNYLDGGKQVAVPARKSIIFKASRRSVRVPAKPAEPADQAGLFE